MQAGIAAAMQCASYPGTNSISVPSLPFTGMDNAQANVIASMTRLGTEFPNRQGVVRSQFRDAAVMQVMLSAAASVIPSGTGGPTERDVARQSAFLRCLQEAGNKSQELFEVARANREKASDLAKQADLWKRRRRILACTSVAAAVDADEREFQDVHVKTATEGNVAIGGGSSSSAAVVKRSDCASEPGWFDVRMWRVAGTSDVNIRKSAHANAPVLSKKVAGDVFHGRRFTETWLELEGDPGYICVGCDETGGKSVVEVIPGESRSRIESDVVETMNQKIRKPGVVSGVPVWRVLAADPVNIRSERTIESKLLGQRHKDDLVRGHFRNDWVELIDEPGYMITVGAFTKKQLLQQVGTAESVKDVDKFKNVDAGNSHTNGNTSSQRNGSGDQAVMERIRMEIPGVLERRKISEYQVRMRHVSKFTDNISLSLEKARETAAASKRTPFLGDQLAEGTAFLPKQNLRASDDVLDGQDLERRRPVARGSAPALGELRAPTGLRAAVAVVQHEALQAAASADLVRRERSQSPFRRDIERETAASTIGVSSRRALGRSASRTRNRSRTRSRNRNPQKVNRDSPRPFSRQRIFSDKPQVQSMPWTTPSSSAAAGAATVDNCFRDVPEWLKDIEMSPAGAQVPEVSSCKKYIRMPDDYIKALVGQGGETLRTAIKRSGAIIRIESGPRDSIGIVSITGNIQLGERCMRDALRAKGLELPEMDGLVVNQAQHGNLNAVKRDDIQIPSQLVKHFVGNRGANIKVLEEAVGGGVAIKVLPTTLMGGFQRIQVTGVNRASAEPLVLARIEELKRCTGAGYGNYGNIQR